MLKPDKFNKFIEEIKSNFATIQESVKTVDDLRGGLKKYSINEARHFIGEFQYELSLFINDYYSLYRNAHRLFTKPVCTVRFFIETIIEIIIDNFEKEVNEDKKNNIVYFLDTFDCRLKSILENLELFPIREKGE